MKVIKPQKLSLLTRTFEYERRVQLVTTVLAVFPFGARTLLSEVALWKLAAAELGKDGVLDLGMPKGRAEIVITGKAYAPGGQATSTFPVRARIGTVDKTLRVIGGRYWRGGRASEPEPLVEMPLTWENAFGGPGYEQNPLGKGFASSVKGAAPLWLPNVEDPRYPIASRSDRPAPAGFGAYDFAWPQRFAKLGTYDAAWLKDHYPGLAQDIDPRAWNVAPSDQHLDRCFDADEAFLLENLHPKKPLIEGTLPGITARCFANQATAQGEVFHEVPLRLETVHLFPNVQCGVLFFRGMIDVADDDAADVLQLVLGAERPDAPRPLDHYRLVLGQRLDRKRAHLFVLRDDDLLPSLEAVPETAPYDRDVAVLGRLLVTEGLVAKNLRRRVELLHAEARERVRAQGLDPDRYVPPLPPVEPTPAVDEIEEIWTRTSVLMEEKAAEAEALRKRAEDDARRQCAEHGLDFDAIVAEQRTKGGGPPKFSAKEQLDHLRAVSEMARNAGVELPLDVQRQLVDPQIEAKLIAIEQNLRVAYVKFGHHFEGPAALNEETSRALREEVAAAHRAGTSLAARDLTAVDLRGLALEGIDLQGALLDSADLSGADLRRADLTGAVLARARLADADLTGARLAGANLGSADLRGAKLRDADLTRTVLVKADLANAELHGAELEGADLAEAILAGTDLRGASAVGTFFAAVELTGSRLDGANLEKSSFLNVDVSGVDFSEARLVSAAFLSVKGEGAVFRGAKLDNMRAVQSSSFPRADFRCASLELANLRGTNLAGADFTEARLDRADMSESDLRGAVFCLSTAVECRMVKANLSNADMTSANLMDAVLQRATAHGTDFQGANLARADLLRMDVDGATNVEGAELVQARFLDARRPHGQG